jgi:iron complex transport system substrate-binding protein
MTVLKQWFNQVIWYILRGQTARSLRHKQSFLITLFCLALWICIGCTPPSTDSIAHTSDSKGDCKTIDHLMGQSCIPLDPQRIVTIDEIALDAVLALGVQPIAAAESSLVGSRGRHLSDKLAEVVSIGRETEPNLERLVQLKPDLILGFNSTVRNHYKSLAQIAPTVAFDYEHTDWKADLQQVGEMLGKRDRAQAQLADYQKRVAEFRSAMGDRSEAITVSIVRFTAATQNVHYRTVASFPGSVLQDVGLSRPIAQQTPTDKPFGDVSLERMDVLDGDVIIAMLDPRSEQSFQQFQNHPLWQTLKAVKTNRVYQVDSGYWSFGNILAANAILDDLFRYLLPTTSR